MPRSLFKRLFSRLLAFIRVFLMAWMIGIANSVKQEGRFMEDTFIKTELMEEQEDDDSFE